jgi:transcriptional regulator with XRE-family HTH domain
VKKNRFGSWLRSARLAVFDTVSGRPFSQQRLAEEMGISASKIAAWETGAILSVSPEDAQRLAELLHRSQREILQAIGYRLPDDAAVTEDEAQVLAAFRQLSPLLQTVERERLRILVQLLRQSGQLEGSALRVD